MDGETEYECLKDAYGYDTYIYELDPGKYCYVVSYSSGSQSATGEFTIEAADKIVKANLAEQTFPVKFKVLPEDANAKIVLKKNGFSGAYGDAIEPDETGVYAVKFGQYRYTVEADGYISQNKTFNATDYDLKNNDYTITIKLKNEADTVLEEACNVIFDKAGYGIFLNEFTGSQGYDEDLKFTPWDIDSAPDDVNVCATIEKMLTKNMPITGKDISVSVEKVLVWPEDESANERVEDYTVVDRDGKIHYDKVAFDMIDEESGGAEYDITLKLSYKGAAATEEATFIVPMHTYTRQERLDDAADFAARFTTIKGNNNNQQEITTDLKLANLGDLDEYGYYSIFSAWESSQPAVISNTGKVTSGDQDITVTLKVKTFYSEAQIESAKYLLDPGPLGENTSYKEINVTVLSAKNGLKTTIEKAKTIYNNAKEGNNYGQYAKGSKAKLNNAIKNAEAVLADVNATNKDKDKAAATLELALTEFHDSRQPLATNVSVVIHDRNQFIYPRKEIQVISNAATEAGYTVADIDAATVFDALVISHQDNYGLDFTNNPKQYLNISNGYITALMGNNNANMGFLINNQYPADENGMGYTADKATLKNGDIIDVFIYRDSNWKDRYLFFDKNVANIEKNKNMTLTLKGYTAMSAYEPSKSIPKEIEDAKIYIGTDWSNLEDSGVKTDNNGKFTLSFDKEGTYFVSSVADRLGDTDCYIAPTCVVTVKNNASNNGGHGGNIISSDPKTEEEKEEEKPSHPTDENTSLTPVNFTDITGHWADLYINQLVDAKLVNGKTATNFAPNDSITRAEFLAILARMSGEKMPSANNKFSDIKVDAWYADYITWAVAVGITNGTSNTSFSPNAEIQRQEMAVMLERYARYMKISIGDSNSTTTFVDSELIADYAKGSIEKIQAAGIINGKEGNQFDPQSNATRAEASKMIVLLRNVVNNTNNNTTE